MPAPAYSFDPSGTLPANRIQNEQRIVTLVNGINAYLLLPEFRPFYADGLLIVDATTGQTLKENTHYYLTHKWTFASDYIGKEIYGSITILNGYEPTVYNLNYQTLGGDYIDTGPTVLAEGLIAVNNLYVNVDWSTAPVAFPSSPHNVSLTGLNGISEILRAFDNLTSAVISPDSRTSVDDIVDYHNVIAQNPLSLMLESSETEYVNNVALVDSHLALLDYLHYYENVRNIDPMVTEYTTQLPGGVIVHVGMIPFSTGFTLTRIRFKPTIRFQHKCIFIHATITPMDNADGVYKDTVAFGDPGLLGGGIVQIPVQVTYARPKTNNTSLYMRYIAVGV